MAIFAAGCGESNNPKPGNDQGPGLVDSVSATAEQTAALEPAIPSPGAPPLAAPSSVSAFKGESHALLVGCTTYDHLGAESALRGPMNDVAMMREVLLERFGFRQNNIRSLSEDVAAQGRPVKANIVQELARLATVANDGDRVVILLSGHGSQQPDNDFDNSEDPEPDGLDEIFCPADINFATSDDSPYAVNALTDDEMRVAINNIRGTGAFVWVIVDACHSGSAVRGMEVYRQIAPERLIGQAALLKARQNAKAGTRSLNSDKSAMDVISHDGGLVAIYAAQPHEPTLEMPLPTESDAPQWRGLLTYTLVKVLTNADTPLSYSELVQRIHGEYVQAFGRISPTPLIEGTDQKRQVLEQTEMPTRSELVLMTGPDGQFQINAGRLHGFSNGTVFAVFPPPGETESQVPLGYVEITRAQLANSEVAPLSFNNCPKNEALPLGGRVEPGEIHFGNLILKVAFDDQSGEATPAAGASNIPDMLSQLQTDPKQRIKFVEGSEKADWIVRQTPSGECFLVPCEGWSKVPDERYFGPAPGDGQLEWFRERLSRIARVKGLLKLCDASEKQSGGLMMTLLGAKKPCAIKLELSLIDARTEESEPIDWTRRNWTLTDGEQVMLEITNSGSEMIDFSVLFIDSRFSITPLFPAPGVIADNRIQPQQSYSLGPLQVESTSVGLEHLLVIATKAEGQPLDFSWLGQESLEAAQSAARGGLGINQNDPLGELLRDTLFSKQNVRGMKMADAEGTCLRSLSWQTIPKDVTE